MKKKKKTKNK